MNSLLVFFQEPLPQNSLFLKKRGKNEKKRNFLVVYPCIQSLLAKMNKKLKKKEFLKSFFVALHSHHTHTPVFNLAKKMKATSTVAFFTRHV